MAITISITAGTGYFGSTYTQVGAAGAGQWYADETPIPGATASTYVLAAANEGKGITFRTTSPAEVSNRIKLFMPEEITGLVADFDAARNDLMTFNAAKVASFPSRVGSLVLNQTTDANRPTWSATGRNSKPAVSGNGTSLFMTLSDPAALPQGVSASAMAAAAYHPNSNAGAWTGLFVYGTSSVSTARQVSKQDSSNKAGISIGSAGSHTFPAGASTWLGNDKIVVGNFKAGTSVPFDATIDGQFSGNSVSGITINTPVPTIAQLFRFTNNSGYWPGSMQELLIWNHDLTQGDREKVEGYLASKWGLRALLPAGHPYKSTNPPSGIAVNISGSGYLPTQAAELEYHPEFSGDMQGYLSTSAMLVDASEPGPITISIQSGSGYAGTTFARDRGSLGEWYLGGQPTGNTGSTFILAAEEEGLTVEFIALNGYRSNRLDYFAPNELHGLLAQFDALAFSTMTRVGGLVSAWASKWGTWSAVQATDANKPSFELLGRNNKPQIATDGVNDFFDLVPTGAGLPDGNEAAHIFTVGFSSASAPAAYRMLIKWGSVNTARRGIAKSETQKVTAIGGTAGTNNVSGINWPGTDKIVSADYQAVGSRLNIDGGDDVINTNVYNPADQGSAFLFRDATVYWPGSAQEILLWNRSLTTAERQKVEGYLASKWGLRGLLPADHPYKSTNPPGGSTVMNASGYLPTSDAFISVPIQAEMEATGLLPTMAALASQTTRLTMESSGYMPTSAVTLRHGFDIEAENLGFLPTAEIEGDVRYNITSEMSGYLATQAGRIGYPLRVDMAAMGLLPQSISWLATRVVINVDMQGYLSTSETEVDVFAYEIEADNRGFLAESELGSNGLYKIDMEASGLLPVSASEIYQPQKITSTMPSRGYLPITEIEAALLFEVEMVTGGYLPTMDAELGWAPITITMDSWGYLPRGVGGGTSNRPYSLAPGFSTGASINVGGGPSFFAGGFFRIG